MLNLNDRSRRVRLLLGILLAASLTLVTIDFRSHGNGPLDKVGNVLSSIFGPLQHGLAKITRPIGNFFAGFGKVGSLKGRIRDLEHELFGLREQRYQLEDLLRENDRLKELLLIKERLGLKTVSGLIIAVGPSNVEDSITIDRGTSEGVRKDMPVVGGGGLVGRVIRASAHTSVVLLIKDPSSSVASRVAPSGEVGILQGNGRSELPLELFNAEARVAVGDQVVTNGYQSGIYPPGIPVGTVSRVEPAGVNLTRRVFVRPYVDFTALEYVLVVTGLGPRPTPPPSPAPSASPSASPSATAGATP